MTELEQELQVFIDDSFSHIDHTDHALDLLTKLHSLMQRDNLRPYLNTKYLNIFTNFSHDLDVVSNMYEVLKADPPIPRNAPPVAGRILWVRHMLKMIEVPMHKFRKHAALMFHRDSKAIIRKYNKIAQAFVDFEVSVHPPRCVCTSTCCLTNQARTCAQRHLRISAALVC